MREGRKDRNKERQNKGRVKKKLWENVGKKGIKRENKGRVNRSNDRRLER